MRNHRVIKLNEMTETVTTACGLVNKPMWTFLKPSHEWFCVNCIRSTLYFQITPNASTASLLAQLVNRTPVETVKYKNRVAIPGQLLK